MKNIILVFSFLCLASGLNGCATAPVYTPTTPAVTGIPGIYHRVEKDQTLWRISKMYNVDLDEIVRINRISEAASIEIGQLIFIPNRQKPQYPAPQVYSASDDFIWRLKGRAIAGFGQTYNNMLNKGINIQPYENNDVVASRSGKVVFYTDDFNGYGKTVIIDHGDGFSTVYARNLTVSVSPGENVGKGALIAKAGSAGRDRSRYLHFEIRKGNIAQNPYFYLSH